MTDWNQRSGFEDFAWTLDKGSGFFPPKMNSILLNGHGMIPYLTKLTEWFLNFQRYCTSRPFHMYVPAKGG